MSISISTLDAASAIDRSRFFDEIVTIVVPGFTQAQSMMRELGICAREDGEEVTLSRKGSVIEVRGVATEAVNSVAWRVNIDVAGGAQSEVRASESRASRVHILASEL